MKRNILWSLLMLTSVALAGCATSDNQRVDTLEARVASLERKVETRGEEQTTSEGPVSSMTEKVTEEVKEEVGKAKAKAETSKGNAKSATT